jgi:phospholipid/cholesterol/gamma-HCH transport system substrate-binding protein
MTRFSLEVKVGLVVTLTVALVLAFLFLLGDFNPFSTTYRLYMLHNYVGGIELGSPVRVAGAKVGKVNSIRFFEAGHQFQGGPVSLALELLIDKRAKHLIRQDSKFYINFEGLIGGKYIEIQPGSVSAPELEDGYSVRGADPPRLEQMLSQGFDIFQRLTELLNQLGLDDREKLKSALSNLVAVSDDLRAITGQVRGNISPIMTDARRLLGDARPLLNQAQVVMRDLDNVTSELGKIKPEKKQEMRAKLDQLLNSVDSLTATLDRLDRLSARLEKETAGVTAESLNRTVREILQQQGITVNVGKITGKANYPKP